MKKYCFFALFLNICICNAQEAVLLEALIEKDWEKIEFLTDSLIQVSDFDYGNYYWRAFAMEKMGKESKAITSLEQAIISGNGNSISKIKHYLVDLYFNQGMYAKTTLLLDSLLKIDRFNINLIRKKVLILEYYKDHGKAIDLLEKVIQRDSVNTFYLTHLGYNYLETGNDSIALEYYTKAYNENPNNMSLANKLATVYLKTCPKAAEMFCESVLEKDPYNIRILQKAGAASLKLKSEKKALFYFKKSLSLGDSSLNTMKNVGMLLQRDMKFHESRKLLEKVYEKDSTSLNVIYYLAMATSNSPNQDEALKLFEKAENLLTPDSTICYLINEQKAQIYALKEDHMRAFECYELCMRYNKSNISLWFYGGFELMQLGEKEKALKYLLKFIEEFNNQKNKKQEYLPLVQLAENNIKRLKEDLFFERKPK